jgi:dynactin complex subunit
MTNEEIAIKLTEQDQKIKSAQHRIDKLEVQQENANQLVRSVDRLAQSMKTMAEEQQRQGEKIDKLEKSKADSIIYWLRIAGGAIVTGLIGYAIGIFLG